MNQFKFEAKQKTFLYAFMALGLLCLIITFFIDDELHTRFWTNYLHNSVFFTGIAFVSLFFLMAMVLAYGGWHVVFKRVWEAYSMFLIVGIVLMLVVVAGVWGHFHHLYHWGDAEAVAGDAILAQKSSFLNPVWYTIATLVIVGVWYFLFAVANRKLSLKEDAEGTDSYAIHKRMRVVAAIFLPIAAFSSAAVIWQWVMSLDAHWYSTMFAWYTTSSWFVAAMCLTVLTLIYLKSKGYYKEVTNDHLHDLGKFIFAFSIFWAYLWFSQYMLIWYANVGEETIYFKTRVDEYPVLFYGNLILNFVLPFFILMRNDTKRKYGILVFVSIIVFLGHWVDFFLMIKPGALHTAHEVIGHHGTEVVGHSEELGHAAEQASSFLVGFTIPGLLELGTMLGFLALFIYVAFHQLSKASLIPKNDPYLQESLHHEVVDERTLL